MKSAKSKFAVSLFAALVLVYLAFQLYSVLSPSYRTEVAVLYTVTDEITAVGTVVREESTYRKHSGVGYYTVSDGDKVAHGDVIAESYASAQHASNKMRLALLEQELAVVRSLGEGMRGSVNLNSLRRSIYEQLTELCASIQSGETALGGEARIELLSMLGSYALSSGSEIDATARATQLQAEIDALSQLELDPTAYIRSEESGYFISFSDSCEKILSPELLQEGTAEQLMEGIQKAHESYAMDNSEYRILGGFGWHYVCRITADEAQRLREGRSYTLNFRHSAAGDLPAQVERIVLDEAGENAVVVFHCERLNEEIAKLRNEEVRIRFSNYSGIRVPRSALHMQDGVVGVYIKYGNMVQFRAVDIIFETEEYVLSSATEGSSNVLSLYDEIIVSGKQLSPGREIS